VDTDLIDDILAQWRHERPDLDASPMAIFARVARVHLLFERAIQRSHTSFGLGRGEFDALATLRRSGQPYRLTPTALAQALMLSSGGMTARLDRLEHLGTIQRLPDPTDRRGTLVALTEAGKRLIDEALTDALEVERRLLEDLDGSQRDDLTRSLRQLLVALEAGDNRETRPPRRTGGA
jgi:DNA-binding MarR family transcriptional regulator